MVAGEILAADGSRPASVQFFRINNSMLLGESRDRSSPVKYGPYPGCCGLFKDVFAVFQAGDAPYQTVRAQVRSKAPDRKPLVVQFLDEVRVAHYA